MVSFWPVGFNLDTYRAMAQDTLFWTSYRNTVVYTLVGTTIAMVLTTTFAYVISKQHLRGRGGVLIGVAVFTMFFNGGLVPNYVLISSLGMKNTMWAVVLPGALSVFNLLVMKSFFENLPRRAGGSCADRRARLVRHLPPHRAAAVQGGAGHDGAVLRRRLLERLVRGRSCTSTRTACSRSPCSCATSSPARRRRRPRERRPSGPPRRPSRRTSSRSR